MEIKQVGKLHLLNNKGEIQNSSIIPILQNEYKIVSDEILTDILLHFKNNICNQQILKTLSIIIKL